MGAKIWLWNDPYGVPYGESVAIACAETEEEARRILTKKAQRFGNPETSKEALETLLRRAARSFDGDFLEWKE